MEVKELNGDKIVVGESRRGDQSAIYEVVRETWLDTYPNEEYGITREDIAAKFLDKDSDKYREIMKQREESSDDPDTHTWVARDGDKVIGFCFAVKGVDKNEIKSIYILPEYQGKGIGKRLMEKAFEWVDRNKDVFLGVATYNTKAKEFYKKMGFRETGREWYTPAATLPSGKKITDIEMVKSFK